MSIIGIDFGNESCLVTAAKAGFIETLANDYSLRATPSCVAFDGKKRIIGVAAKNQQVTNTTNTVCGFKHLLGRKFNDPHVQRESCFMGAKIEPLSDGEIGIKVNYLDKDKFFTPVQLTAMLLSKVKEIAASALQGVVCDVVVTCPVFFTNAERRALLDACQIAGLNVLRLMNETTATALYYGFYKMDLSEERPRNVVFVDWGQSSLQVSACAFSKGKLKMLASTWDSVGGRDVDAAMAAYFAEDFKERYKINACSNPRTYLRLLTEVEKLKKQMSASSTRLPMTIECFVGDNDVSTAMQRSQMDEVCVGIFRRIEATLRKLLQESKLSLEEIHSVEVVGGSTRIPAIKQLIEEVFGKPASTTLNQEESVSCGATLQCAMASPLMRAREFGIADIQNYAVKVCWEGEGNSSGGEMLVFPTYYPVPSSRVLTMNRREPFIVTLQYAEAIPYPDTVIGKWLFKDIAPNEHGEPQEVKIKVRVNNHGIVMISSAAIVIRKEIDETKNSHGEEQLMHGSNSAEQGNGVENSTPVQDTTEKKKKPVKLIDLHMEVKMRGHTAAELHEFIKQENKMVTIDGREKERADARNTLEEYVYSSREKLRDGGALERFILASDREAICGHLEDLADWLYTEGEHCARDVYEDKLKNLRKKLSAINERAHDYEVCPTAFEDLKHSIMYARDALKDFESGSPKYNHLSAADLVNISEACERTQKWYEMHFSSFLTSPRTHNSPVKVNEILYQNQLLTTLVNSILKLQQPTNVPENMNQTEVENENVHVEESDENPMPEKSKTPEADETCGYESSMSIE